ncbi:MAG: ketoacyl-ACP synthase III [Pyrinomonadaceae bacterium]|nr:ketoacyl-ACP synthase III [Pyrinomonadaceae bacterium]
MRNGIIIGTAHHVPDKVLTNDDLSRILGEDISEFVSTKLGILERRVLAENESAADLATEAGRKALENAGITADDVDLIILATDTPEYLSPATSAVVQYRLGAKRAGTFDVNCACAGFVTAFDTALKYIIADSNYKNVLVVGVYAMTKFLDWTEKKTATMFADGAGAVVLRSVEDSENVDKRGLLTSKLEADGSYYNFLGIFAGGSKTPITHEVINEGYFNKVRFVTKYPPEVNINGWQRIVHELLDRVELKLDDIKLFLWTQVNLSTIEIVMKEMDLPMSRTHTIMHKWGYTGSACIPMLLDDAVNAGKIKRNDNLIICASGGGLNMAAMVYRF